MCYDSNSGTYINQSPIDVEGYNPKLYAYTHDSNSWAAPLRSNSKLFESSFWKAIKNSVNWAKYKIKIAKIYGVIKIIVVPNGKKGYLFHIDTFHDGVEIYNKFGKHKGSLV